MGRKIRSIIFLGVLLVLIYWQQSEIIYAEEFRERDDKISADETGEEDDKDDVKPEEIKKYEVKYSEADGRNGYYITAPQVEILHPSNRGKTVYCLQNQEEVRAEGELTEEGDTVILSGEQFRTGKNILTLYMEDEEGKKIETYRQSIEFLLDMENPTFEMYASEGFEKWYRDEAWMQVTATDGETGSGVASISCYCGNEIIGTVEGQEGQFLINYASVNQEGAYVTVTVVDRAGRVSEASRKMYIDNCAPKLEIKGITDYMITSEPTLMTGIVSEENGLIEYTAKIERENPDGTKNLISDGEWKEGSEGQIFALTLAEDGIYHISISASDLAGHYVSESRQVIVDTHNPVIRYVDELDGTYMKTFSWNYGKEVFIRDFTSYVHQIQLDGRLYSAGTQVKEEGYHILQVEAIDAAGNKAEAKAGFVVDATPPKVLFEGVEENGEYEEKREFKITLENPEDTIQEVRINGILKPTEENARVHTYTVEEDKHYEIAVKAHDYAGNETLSRMAFEVVPKETVLEKAIKPIRKVLGRKRENIKEEEKEEGSMLLPVVFVGGLSGMGVMCVVKYRKRREASKK